MKVFVCGDTHGALDIQKLNTKNFPEQKSLTKEDVVIVLGDFGLQWVATSASRHWASQEYWLDWLQMKPFTTLFVDGNHENHEMLNELLVIEKYRGKVGIVRPGIYHLKRGEIFQFNSKKVFIFGGALSTDKQYRIEGVDWWRGEVPTTAEFTYGLQKLEAANDTVDFILSHTAPKSVIPLIAEKVGFTLYEREADTTANYLEFIKSLATYTEWHFGHFHIDACFQEKHFCHYKFSPIRII